MYNGVSNRHSVGIAAGGVFCQWRNLLNPITCNDTDMPPLQLNDYYRGHTLSSKPQIRRSSSKPTMACAAEWQIDNDDIELAARFSLAFLSSTELRTEK
jgi:hypothetical protein